MKQINTFLVYTTTIQSRVSVKFSHPPQDQPPTPKLTMRHHRASISLLFLAKGPVAMATSPHAEFGVDARHVPLCYCNNVGCNSLVNCIQ